MKFTDILFLWVIFSQILLQVNLLNHEPYVHIRISTSTSTKVHDLKIVGGYRCPIKDHPYMVSVRGSRSNRLVCGGSLVSEFWVLTAAHCCPQHYSRGTFRVVAGTSNVFEWGTKASLVYKCYGHKDYDAVNNYNDIALLRLKNPIKETELISYVKLPEDDAGEDLVKLCSQSTVIGWGDQYAKNASLKPLTTPVPPYDPYLQCVELSVVNRSNCGKIYERKFPSTIVCAYSEKKDACHGDSGGPLLCHGVQYGIVADGIGCAYKDIPGFYTRVDKYLSFINEIISRSCVTAVYLNTCISIIYFNLFFVCVCIK